MRVFIAGASGVLGRELIPMLLAEGNEVVALVRDPNRAEKALAGFSVRLYQGDLVAPDTASRLPEMLAGCDAAVHIATSIPADPSAPSAWETTARLRIDGTRFLTGAALAAGVRRYVQQSIVMAYADGGDWWLDESAPLDTSPERASVCGPVITMERTLHAIPTSDLQWCVLRGGSFVGPGTAQELTIARLREGTEVVPGDGSNFISPVEVADMATAIVAALKRAPGGSTFNIVDEPLRQSEYLDHLATLVGAHTPPRGPSKRRPPSFRCTNQAARQALGWIPRRSIWPLGGAGLENPHLGSGV